MTTKCTPPLGHKRNMTYSENLQPGDIILTSYGVAVVVKTYVDNGEKKLPLPSFKARLWREPGKSVTSSATAYMQFSCVSDPTFLFATSYKSPFFLYLSELKVCCFEYFLSAGDTKIACCSWNENNRVK
jgi:hypothetical protein